MRIAVIITGLGIGGTELALLSVVEHCDRSRYHFHVVCLYDEDNRLIPRFAELGVPVTVLKLYDYARRPLFRYSQYRFLQLVRLLRRSAFDVVHTMLPQANRSGGLAAHLAGVRSIVATVCNEDRVPPRGLGLAVDRMLGKRTCTTVCKSQSLLEYDRRVRALPAERYRVIYNGVDTERFDRDAVRKSGRRPPGLPARGPIVGSVGRLHPQKAHDTLIEAIAIVRRRAPAASLVIVGDGAERSALEARARALGVGEAVLFLGFREDIPELLASFDVFVLASLYEGNPNSVLEALSTGLPVVVTDIPSSRDVIIPGETGLMVPPRAAAEMAAAIETLLEDEATRLRLGANGRRTVLERFSLQKMVRAYEQLYSECARRQQS